MYNFEKGTDFIIEQLQLASKIRSTNVPNSNNHAVLTFGHCIDIFQSDHRWFEGLEPT